MGEGASKKFEVEGKLNLDKMEDGNVNYYSFKTEAEKEAFMRGVNSADGWLGNSIFTNEEVTIRKNIFKKVKSK